MALEETVVALIGGVTAGGIVQGLGAWYIVTRLKKIDSISRRLDRFIQYFRVTDKRFAEYWQENGGEE